MSIVAKELAEGWDWALADGKTKASRLYYISDTGGASVTEADALAALPALGTAWPGIGGAYVSGYASSVVDAGGAGAGSARAWKFKVQYSSTGQNQPDQGEGEEDFVAVEVESEAILLDHWRILPDGGSWDYFPTTLDRPLSGAANDIGGVQVDDAGSAISMPHIVAMVNVRNVLAEANYLRTTYEGALGTRNDATYQGYAAGRLLYARVSAARLAGGLVEVRHTFAADAYAHMRQVAMSDPATNKTQLGAFNLDGTPLVGPPSGTEPLGAAIVNWRQPFPQTSDFASLGVSWT